MFRKTSSTKYGFQAIVLMTALVFSGVLFVNSTQPARALSVELKKGGTKTVSTLDYDNEHFILDSMKIHRDDIKKIIFVSSDTLKNQESGQKAAPSDPDNTSSDSPDVIEILGETAVPTALENSKGIAIKDKQDSSEDALSEDVFIDGKSDFGKFVRKNIFPGADLNEYETRAKELTALYPDAEEVILKDWGVNKLNPDGTRVYRYTAAVKVLKDSAVSSGRISLGLTEDRENVYFNLARNIMPDGEIVYPLARDIEISEGESGGASISRYKVLTINIPRVKVGSIVEYSYTKETYNPFKKDIFFPSFSFTDYNPVGHSRFEVVTPAGYKLAWAGKNMEGASEPQFVPAQDEKGFDTRIWEFFNVEPIIPEPRMPSYSDVAKSLKVSSYEKDWNRFFKWRRSLVEDKIKPTKYITELAQTITQGCGSDREKSAALYHWIQKNIRYISVKSGIGSGLGGHFAEETLKNGFGDCIDKAIVMAAMHQSLGIEAYPVALKTNSSNEMERRIPCFDTNHAISIVYLDGEPMILDATSSNYRYPYFREDDHGVYCINYFKDELYFIKVPAPEDNASVFKREYRVDSAGAVEVTQSSEYTGSSEAGFRGYIKSLREDRRKRALQQMVAGFLPGGVLLDYKFHNVDDISKPFWYECSYKGDNFLSKAGEYWILDLKEETTFPEVNLEERKYDLEYYSSELKSRNYTIHLPAGLTVSFLPRKTEIKNRWCEFTGEYILSDSSTLIYKTEFKRFERIVKKEDYKEYKKFLKTLEKFYEEKVFLKKASLDTDNLLVLKDGTEDRGSVVSIDSKKVKFKNKDSRESEYDVSNVSRIEVYKTYSLPGEDHVDQIRNEEIKNLIQKPLESKDYPNAGKVTLLYERVCTLDKSGTWTETNHVLNKVLMERGKSSGTFHGSYVPGTSEFKINFARSIKDDTIKYLTDYSVTEADRYASYPEYNKVKKVKAVVPAVNVDTYVEYSYEKKAIKPDILDSSLYYVNFFTALEPCLTDRSVLIYPENAGLVIIKKNWTPDIKETIEKLPMGMIRHSFERNNITPTVQEANRPPSIEYQPGVIATVKKDFSLIAKEYSRRLDNVERPDPAGEFSKKVKHLAMGLDSTKPEEGEKIIANLYQFIVKNIELVSPQPYLTGFTPRKADDIFSQSRGNSLDKTWLFSQALDLCGIKNHLILLHPDYEGSFQPDATDINQFSDFAVRLEDTKKIIYVNYKYNLLYSLPVEFTGSQALAAGKEDSGLIFIPRASLDSELVLREYTAQMDASGTLHATDKNYYSGSQGTGYRDYFYYKKADLDKRMERRVAAVHSRASLINYTFKNLEFLNKNIETGLEYKIDSYPKRAGDRVLAFQVPDFHYYASEFGRDTREYPLFLGGITNSENIFKISIPKGYKVSYISDSFSISHDGVSLEFDFSVQDNLIIVKEKYRRWKQLFSRDFYFKFKKLAEKRSLSRREWIVLEKE